MNSLRHRAFRRGVLVATALALTAVMVAPSAGAGPRGRNGIQAFDYGYRGIPSRIVEDRWHFQFANAGQEPHEIVVFKLAPEHEDATIEEAIAAADAEDDSFISEFAGFAFAFPGQVEPGNLHLDQPGGYVYFCFIPTENGTPHYQLGMVGFIEAL